MHVFYSIRRSALLAHSISHPYRMGMAIALALSVGTALAQEQDALPEIYQQGDISYISGGIGSDETLALESVQSDYNLRITSADILGHFRGDTEIIIRDMKRTVLLDMTTQGPLFYAKLPNGRYVVEGVSDGQSKAQKVTIASGKSSLIHFSWPISAGDAVQPPAPAVEPARNPLRIG